MSVASQPNAETVAALTGQLASVYYVVKANIEGMTHEDSLVQPTPGGNCLNWVMGHLMTARNGVLPLLGREPLWDDRTVETYKRGSQPLTDPSTALSFDKIMADFDKSQEMITQGLREITSERMAEKAPYSPTNNPNETVGSLLAGLAFHDAYHAGQTGILRRIAGKDGAIK